MDLREKLNFPTPNEEKHYPECLETEDDVEEEETATSTGTAASTGSHESGSQGPPSEQSDLSRREPASTYQSSAPDLLRPPPEKGAQHLYEIPPQTHSHSPSHPSSKVVSEYKPKPTRPSVEGATLSSCEEREERESDDEGKIREDTSPQKGHKETRELSEVKGQLCGPSTVTLPEEVLANIKLRNDVTLPPPPSPPSQQHENRQALILSAEGQNDIGPEEEVSQGHSNSDCGEVPNSPSLPAPIPAEMTGHSDAMVPGSSLLSDRPFTNMDIGAFSGLDFSGRVICLPPPIDKSAGSHHPSEDPPLYSSSEEVDAAEYVQTLISPLEQSHLTPNERDQKYIERRDYNVSRVVGIGGQGVCSLIGDVTTRALAVQKASKSENDEDCLRECKMLSNLRHNNLICFLGAVREKAAVKMFLEFAPYGTIRVQFRDEKCFQMNPALICHILEQIFRAVSYLHQNGILHRDIKGDNVLTFKNWCCKLADFGLAIYEKEIALATKSYKEGTWCYNSPEYSRNSNWSYPSDVWSAMSLLVEMMTGEVPWHSFTECRMRGVYTIGCYSKEKDFRNLLNAKKYRRKLRPLYNDDVESQPAIFDQLEALAREVFVEDPAERPPADALLNRPVMIRASTYITKTTHF